MGMGMGSGASGGYMSPLSGQEPPVSGGPDPHSNLEYRWSEGVVDQKLPFVKSTKRILNSAQTQVQPDKNQNIKDIIRQELETLGWDYNDRDSFKSSLSFRRKSLVFDSTDRLDADDRYRLEVVMGRGGVSGYKLMKWVVMSASSGDSAIGSIVDWVTYTRTGKLAVLLIVLSFIVFIVLQFTVCATPNDYNPDLSSPAYHTYWEHPERKGYSGVAVFSKEE